MVNTSEGLQRTTKKVRILFQTDIDYNKAPSKNWSDFDFDIGGNTGNLLFANSLQFALSKQETLVRRMKWEEIPGFVRSNSIDLVVINCANWLRPHYLSFLKRVNNVIAQINVPILMIGLGANTSISEYHLHSYKSLRSIDDVVRELMMNIARTNGKIGVRGEFTLGYFDYLGGSENVVVTGCPSLLQFTNLNTSLLDERSQKKHGILGLSHNKILDNLRGEKLNSEYYFICQDSFAKFLLFPSEITRAEVRRILALDPHIISLLRDEKIKVFSSLGGWMSWVSSNLAHNIGGRIHGGLLALHAGVPSLFFRHDSRLAEFIDLYALPYFDEPIDLLEKMAILRRHDWSKTRKRMDTMKTKIAGIFKEYEVELSEAPRPLNNELPIEQSRALASALSSWTIWIPMCRFKLIRFMVSFFVYCSIQNALKKTK